MQFNPTLHKLSNGLTVILDPMELETAQVKVRFDTGSRDELPHEYGITHFCEHMLCTGTSRFPTKRDLGNHLSDNAGYFNAFTSETILEFHGRILGDNLGVLIDCLADMLKNSKFDDTAIELERTAILDERRRALDNPDRQCDDFISRTLHGNDIMSFRTIGTEENIKSFTREQMLDWVRRRLSTKNCVIAISGKITDKNAVLKQISDAFAFLPRHDVSTNKELVYMTTTAHNLRPTDASVSLTILAPKLYTYTLENYFGRQTERKLMMYLQQELQEVLRSQNGLVYAVRTDVWGGGFNQQRNMIMTKTSAKNIGRVVELVAKTMSGMLSDKQKINEFLQRSNRRAKLGDADWKEDPKSRSGTLITHYKRTGQLYNLDEVIKLQEGMTADDIVKYCARFFDKDVSIITTGPKFDDDLMAIWNKNFTGMFNAQKFTPTLGKERE